MNYVVTCVKDAFLFLSFCCDVKRVIFNLNVKYIFVVSQLVNRCTVIETPDWEEYLRF